MSDEAEIQGLANMISSLSSMIINLSNKVTRLERRLEQATIESDYTWGDTPGTELDCQMPVKRLVLGDGK